MTGAARVPIGKVTMKRGGLVVLPFPDLAGRDRLIIREHIDDAMLEHGGPYTGFAFVVWGRDGRTRTIYFNWSGSPISNMMVPDFVRGQLLAAAIDDALA